MLLAGPNFSYKAIIELPEELINSCKTETVVHVPLANSLATPATDITKQ
jgi:hypothetical protein